ncbi:hypothetical protein C8N46_108158 [Kordia periserrulae]|uniref:Uncharacterized protein n=1 Tax=Kordia periserrulae TaxID=701523 RepID=A0A2T6BUV2_9FLAO|nr:hypothetical protein [Kordia periserrulae]PTX59845.1 hypothetical protein C8N46_108158 [Kordia periserrulae]
MSRINFNKWAFHFSIWILIIIILKETVVQKYFFTVFTEDNRYAVAISAFESIMALLFLGILIFLLASILHKKAKNYQFWIATFVGIFYVLRFLYFMFN